MRSCVSRERRELTSFSDASDSFSLYCLSGSFPNNLYCRTRIPLYRKLC
jgi:hypothetical protein